MRELRARFPKLPIGQPQDHGWRLSGSGDMAKAGATHVVVMARAHEETLKVVVKAGKDYGIGVMGDNLGCPDMVAGANCWKTWAAAM